MPTQEINPFDITPSVEEFLASPELYPELSIEDGRVCSYPHRLPSPPELWGNVPQADWIAWNRVFLNYWPVWPRVTAMAAMSRAHGEGRVLTFSLWTPVAVAFHAVGFTPELYRDLRAALDELLGENDHPLLRVIPGGAGPRCTVLRAADWAGWPGMIASGLSAVDATRQILDAGGQSGITAAE